GGDGASSRRGGGHYRAQCPRGGRGEAARAPIAFDLGCRRCRDDALRLVRVRVRPGLAYLVVPVFAFAGCTGSPNGESAKGSAQAGTEELRIVSLAPHIAELLFAVGAGESLVGVTAYTNYPAAAADLPQVG